MHLSSAKDNQFIAIQNPTTLVVGFFFYSSLETRILVKSEEVRMKREKYKKKRQSSVENCRFFLAAGLGFEPRQTESESAVLPLHNPAILIAINKKVFGGSSGT